MLESVWLCSIWSLFYLVLCPELPVITMKPGDNVLLRCKYPTNDSIGLLEWIRPDLLLDGYVFYFTDEKPNTGFQHKIFRDRVELSEPQMKDGDVSVVLRNVTANDTGTYVCNVTTNNRAMSITISEISLIVKDQGDERTYAGTMVVMSIFWLCLAVFFAAVVIKICMTYKGYRKQDLDDTDNS